jgi:hypothetical protein
LLHKSEFSNLSLRRSLSGPNVIRLAYFAGFLICSCATFMTQSRGGITAALLTFVLIASLYLARLARQRSWKPLVAGVLAALALFVAWIPTTSIGFRLSQAGWLDPGRREAYSGTVVGIREFPVLGTGLGTFREVFPALRGSADTTGTWNEAHSSPLQFALEMGVPLAVAFSLLAFYLAGTLAVGTLHRRRYADLPLCGLAALTVGLLHSFLDFSLQVSGYALPWAGLIAIGLAQCRPRSNDAHAPGGEGLAFRGSRPDGLPSASRPSP